MSALGRVQQGVLGAGGRGAGVAATGIGARGNADRLRRDARPVAGVLL